MKRAIFHGLLLCAMLLLAACENYYFDAPQPIDEKNIYEFPKSFRGRWQEGQEPVSFQFEMKIPLNGDSAKGEESFSLAVNDSTGSSETSAVQPLTNTQMWLEIGRKQVMIIQHEVVPIAKGYWPRANDSGILVYPAWTSRVFYRINYDSTDRVVDTFAAYVIRGPMIYQVEDQKLSKGYLYRDDADTITMFKNDTTSIVLGRQAFLRKLQHNTYVLNRMSSFDDSPGGWWHINILKLDEAGNLQLGDCNSQLTKEPSMIYCPPGSKNYYFISRWTSAYMVDLLNKGSFYFTEYSKRQ